VVPRQNDCGQTRAAQAVREWAGDIIVRDLPWPLDPVDPNIAAGAASTKY
jgi:hypothetical protein